MDTTVAFFILISVVNVITCLLLLVFIRKMVNFETTAIFYYAQAAIINYVAVTLVWKFLHNIAFSYYFGDYDLMAVLGILAVMYSFMTKSKKVEKCRVIDSVFLVLIACGICWAYIAVLFSDITIYFSSIRLFFVLVICFLPILYILLFAFKRVEGLLVFGICNIVIAIYFVYHMYGLIDYYHFYFMFFMYISNFIFSLFFAYISLKGYFSWRNKLAG